MKFSEVRPGDMFYSAEHKAQIFIVSVSEDGHKCDYVWTGRCGAPAPIVSGPFFYSIDPIQEAENMKDVRYALGDDTARGEGPTFIKPWPLCHSPHWRGPL